MEYVLVALLLLIYAGMDCYYHKIFLPLSYIAAVGIIVMKCIYGTCSIELLTGLVPGILFILLAFLSPKQVGLGDGIVLLLLGMVMPFLDLLFLMMTASTLLFLYGLLLQFFRCFLRYFQRERGRLVALRQEKEIPMIPFLCASYYWWMFMR